MYNNPIISHIGHYGKSLPEIKNCSRRGEGGRTAQPLPIFYAGISPGQAILRMDGEV
jgi:hypothetical protein